MVSTDSQLQKLSSSPFSLYFITVCPAAVVGSKSHQKPDFIYHLTYYPLSGFKNLTNEKKSMETSITGSLWYMSSVGVKVDC